MTLSDALLVVVISVVASAAVEFLFHPREWIDIIRGR
jgi:hypothetical protein